MAEIEHRKQNCPEFGTFTLLHVVSHYNNCWCLFVLCIFVLCNFVCFVYFVYCSQGSTENQLKLNESPVKISQLQLHYSSQYGGHSLSQGLCWVESLITNSCSYYVSKCCFTLATFDWFRSFTTISFVVLSQPPYNTVSLCYICGMTYPITRTGRYETTYHKLVR